MAYTNETKNDTVHSFGYSALKTEDDNFLLTEDGFKILLEPEEGPKTVATVTYSNESKNTT